MSPVEPNWSGLRKLLSAVVPMPPTHDWARSGTTRIFQPPICTDEGKFNRRKRSLVERACRFALGYLIFEISDFIVGPPVERVGMGANASIRSKLLANFSHVFRIFFIPDLPGFTRMFWGSDVGDVTGDECFPGNAGVPLASPPNRKTRQRDAWRSEAGASKCGMCFIFLIFISILNRRKNLR